MDNKYTFDYKPASMPNLGSGATVVLMQPADLRPYVVKGEEPKTFVMEWDLDATVYDQSGKVVQTKKVQGKESLAGSMMNPVKASKKKVPEFIYQKVHELIAGVT